jgi:hypothetical protein
MSNYSIDGWKVQNMEIYQIKDFIHFKFFSCNQLSELIKSAFYNSKLKIAFVILIT